MVAALAGRRPDPVDSGDVRFPLENVRVVYDRIRHLFQTKHVSDLVCSAACGADLIALDVAGSLNIRRHIVLPFNPARFRQVSVTDRPGQWGELFDAVIEDVGSSQRLKVLENQDEGEEAFAAVTKILLETAKSLGTRESLLAVIVWEGTARPGRDLTAEMLKEARTARFSIAEISTI